MSYHPVPSPPLQRVTIKGRIVYTGGPWGSNRPVRRFVLVNYRLYEPGAFAGPDAFDMNPNGGVYAVGTSSIDADGRFTITGDATFVPANGQSVEDVLEFQDITQGEWETIPLDGITWGEATQDVGKLKVGWDPPLKTLASVDSVSFHDTRGLALRLIKLIERAHVRPEKALITRIVLPREPGPGEEYSRAQQMFDNVRPSRVPDNFPARLQRKLNKIAILHSSSTDTVDSMIDFLGVMSRLDIKMLESGNFVGNVMERIRDAFYHQIESGVSEEAPDAAAICALIYCAARIAKDGAKISVSYGIRRIKNPPVAGSDREYKTVELTISR